ncbi:helix-turn-helix domain-containing protein [Dyadobacter psychrotolerans]|uniref:AraC family transcriptional regulator n=1 Tax=Dyadobacter psychrotolerans TaxID=2541721 RepID=A0A4R5DM69_9BACT|nr:helix-turn-helix domain-containing protein [Dyadobacter psychrotolerans]TDE15219.1 AraC family transcriptional regulator [Dyadobacter psychrotolerans]
MKAVGTDLERSIVNLKELGIQSAVLLGKYVYNGARSHLQTHAHEHIIEFVYCDNGAQVYEVNQQQYEVHGGDVFVTFPGEPHSSANHPEAKGAIYWLQIRIPESGAEFLGYAGLNAQAFLGKLLSLPCRHFKGNALIKNGFEQIFQLCQSPMSPYSVLSVHVQLARLLQCIIECAAAAAEVTGAAAGDDLRLERVKKYIDDHLKSDLSIQILADHHHISESHFKKWFKEHIGITPMDYIQRKRIEKAKKTLCEKTDRRIADIAFELNFSSSQYFTTVFKKYAGITPLEYKRLTLAERNFDSRLKS